MCLNVEKNIYTVYTKILFHCLNANTKYPLSPDRIKLEK